MATETREITNSDDVIDSRDIIARIEALEESDERDDEETAELASLKALAEEGENATADWTYGATLISDAYFEDYARELAVDIGAISKDTQWPATCIDWERAARELQSDYTSVDFDGVTYWVR